MSAIQPKNLLSESVRREDNSLFLKNKRVNLDHFERVHLIGFGKGAADVSAILEKVLGDKLTNGRVIDTKPFEFRKIKYTVGTHPLPSKQNIDFTETVLKETEGLSEKDLVLIVICGGGSALFEAPFSLPLKQLAKVSSELINSGADIAEINVVRKHLSKVKGGGLAKHLYPAKIVNLIFSDVPGNDLNVIASGPTVRDRSSIERAKSILKKYKINNAAIPESALIELPKEEKYFEKVSSVLMLSNMTALTAMSEAAKEMGYKSVIFSDRIQGDARKLGRRLIEQTPPGKILLAGGETTIKVTGKGKGGRNQALVLACLPMPDDTLILSFDSDGVDFYYYGGAIGDSETNQKIEKLKLDPSSYLSQDDSFAFFEKTKDGIFTGKLGSNVTDLIMVLKI